MLRRWQVKIFVCFFLNVQTADPLSTVAFHSECIVLRDIERFDVALLPSNAQFQRNVNGPISWRMIPVTMSMNRGVATNADYLHFCLGRAVQESDIRCA